MTLKSQNLNDSQLSKSKSQSSSQTTAMSATGLRSTDTDYYK